MNLPQIKMALVGSGLCFLVLGIRMPRCDDPVEVCFKAAEIVALTSMRCSDQVTFDEARQAFMDSVAYGNCRTVKRVRDLDALMDDCLPWLTTAPCSFLEAGQYLPACLGQFSSEKTASEL